MSEPRRIERVAPSITASAGGFKPKQKTDPQGWIVLAITLVVIVIFFAWLAVTLSADSKPADVVQRCSPGLCVFDIFTGIKRCPVDGQVEGLRIAPGLEFCTSANFCQNDPYNCAVQLDQTVRCDGVCGAGNDKCRCIADPFSTS